MTKKHRKKNSITGPTSINPNIREKNNGKANFIYFDFVRNFIVVAGILTSLIFTWLQFSSLVHDKAVINILSYTNTMILMKVFLAIYLYCWVNGTRIDLNDEKDSFYAHQQSIWKFTVAMLYILLLWGVFILVCKGDNPRSIALWLLAFYFLDFIGWRHLLHYMKPMYEMNNEKKIHDHGYYNGKFIEEYLKGRGQKLRFATCFIILISANVGVISGAFNWLQYKLSIQSQDFLVVLFMVAFIIVNETWMWKRRLRRKMKIHVFSLISKEQITQIEFEEEAYL